MRSRRATTLTFAGVVLASAVWWSAPVARADAGATTTCTWGGTPAAPTGTFTVAPGATNTPSVGPSVFKVTGELAGGPGCSATFTYDGLINAGSTCSLTTFQGRATGLPTVRRFAGNGITLFGPARLYDKDGNVVGSEDAQAVTPYNLAHLKDCDTPQGFTKGSFSSVIVLIQNGDS